MLDSSLGTNHGFQIEEIPNPGDLLQLLETPLPREFLFFWNHPETDRQILGLGVAHEIITRGERRFEEANRRALDLLAPALENNARDPEAPLPCVVGGFGFSDHDPSDHRWREFPACRLVVPAALWVRRGSRCWLVRSDALRSDPSPARAPSTSPIEQPLATESSESWGKRVESALSLIERGDLGKVVLSRANGTQFEEPDRVLDLVEGLSRNRPGCFTHWLHGPETDFFGSTPELLVRTEGRSFVTESVAGTMARGATPAEDSARAASLLASDKNRREQAVVSEAIRGQLGQCATDLEIDRAVRILTVPEAHHLASTFRGTLNEDRSALEVAGVLHPTPAVCGMPQETARAFIRESDPERGWFTGACGWMDAVGSGEWAVSLRSALVDGEQITAFAGAGIVAGSTPEEEYAETNIKLRALESLLETQP